METTYYTLRAAETAAAGSGVAQASGGDGRQVTFLRQAAPKQIPYKEDNVISLEEYRAKKSAPAPWTDQEEAPVDSGQPRPRTDHSRDSLRVLEIIATLAIIAVALSACVAFLL